MRIVCMWVFHTLSRFDRVSSSTEVMEDDRERRGKDEGEGQEERLNGWRKKVKEEGKD